MESWQVASLRTSKTVFTYYIKSDSKKNILQNQKAFRSKSNDQPKQRKIKKMERNIRLSKNQIRSARIKSAQVLRQKEKQQEESNPESQGKIMIGTLQAKQSKSDISEELLKKIEQMQKIIFRYEEIIFNQDLQIRELTTNINMQNNEMEIFKNQLIESKVVTEEQL